MIRHLLSIFLLLPLFIFNSCIEGEEEIWIHQDGSGKIRAHYTLPSIALASIGPTSQYIDQIKAIDENEPGLKVTSLSFKRVKADLVFDLEFTFDSLQDLADLTMEAPSSGDTNGEDSSSSLENMSFILGDISLKFEDMTPSYDRKISFSALRDQLPKNINLKDSSCRYILHLPAKIKESNAHQISEDGKSATWTFLLKDNLDQPIEMKLASELPIPWWAWAVAALIILLLLWILWRIIRAVFRLLF